MSTSIGPGVIEDEQAALLFGGGSTSVGGSRGFRPPKWGRRTSLCGVFVAVVLAFLSGVLVTKHFLTASTSEDHDKPSFCASSTAPSSSPADAAAISSKHSTSGTTAETSQKEAVKIGPVEEVAVGEKQTTRLVESAEKVKVPARKPLIVKTLSKANAQKKKMEDTRKKLLAAAPGSSFLQDNFLEPGGFDPDAVFGSLVAKYLDGPAVEQTRSNLPQAHADVVKFLQNTFSGNALGRAILEQMHDKFEAGSTETDVAALPCAYGQSLEVYSTNFGVRKDVEVHCDIAEFHFTSDAAKVYFGTQLRKEVAAMDTDHDGFLSAAEINDEQCELLQADHLYGDDDGKLTVEEMERACRDICMPDSPVWKGEEEEFVRHVCHCCPPHIQDTFFPYFDAWLSTTTTSTTTAVPVVLSDEDEPAAPSSFLNKQHGGFPKHTVRAPGVQSDNHEDLVAIMDTNHDGFLSAEEINDDQCNVLKLDQQSGDGERKISLKKLDYACSDYCTPGAAGVEDLDEDVLLEICHCCPPEMQEAFFPWYYANREYLKAQEDLDFAKMDADDDGRLIADEIHDGMCDAGKVDHEWGDGDGQLTVKEVHTMCDAVCVPESALETLPEEELMALCHCCPKGMQGRFFAHYYGRKSGAFAGNQAAEARMALDYLVYRNPGDVDHEDLQVASSTTTSNDSEGAAAPSAYQFCSVVHMNEAPVRVCGRFDKDANAISVTIARCVEKVVAWDLTDCPQQKATWQNLFRQTSEKTYDSFYDHAFEPQCNLVSTDRSALLENGRPDVQKSFNLVLVPFGWKSRALWKQHTERLVEQLEHDYPPLNAREMGGRLNWHRIDAWPRFVGSGVSDYECNDVTGWDFVNCFFDADRDWYRIARFANDQCNREYQAQGGLAHMTVLVQARMDHRSESDNAYGFAMMSWNTLLTPAVPGWSYKTAASTVAHELGHALFGLEDEYHWTTTSTFFPNCGNEKSQCNRWLDLIDAGLSGCYKGSCQEEQGYIDGPEVDSVMAWYGRQMSHSQKRISCCKYFKVHKFTPAYCDVYNRTYRNRTLQRPVNVTVQQDGWVVDESKHNLAGYYKGPVPLPLQQKLMETRLAPRVDWATVSADGVVQLDITLNPKSEFYPGQDVVLDLAGFCDDPGHWRNQELDVKASHPLLGKVEYPDVKN
ncbi:unnamed protein product [Amoebophrya sp. A120]|nr:unnamed protein product [Amoebophrya sp. A120]|eukprot:GSA120T00011872001.1